MLDKRTTLCARAFTEGSLARLAGLPRNTNPYVARTQAYRAWREGWDDVQANWPHRLPPVVPRGDPLGRCSGCGHRKPLTLAGTCRACYARAGFPAVKGVEVTT